MFRKLVLPALAVCGFGAYLALGSAAAPVYGEPVSDEAAAEARGGICQNVDLDWCPGNDTWSCPYDQYVTAGDHYGEGSGDSYCSSSCGSYFYDYEDCPGSGS